mmetsp:Transcript_9199/g.20383  ORF Transcript_9199/g.20383 Transcript_9199/m.20383 type:complete len:276 (+) Transcript_9199:301-1128(+)
MHSRYRIGAVDEVHVGIVMDAVNQHIVISRTPDHKLGHLIPVEGSAIVEEEILRVPDKLLPFGLQHPHVIVRIERLISHHWYIPPVADHQDPLCLVGLRGNERIHSFHLEQRLDKRSCEDDVAIHIPVKDEVLFVLARVVLRDVEVERVEVRRAVRVRLDFLDDSEAGRFPLLYPLWDVCEEPASCEAAALQTSERLDHVLLRDALSRLRCDPKCRHDVDQAAVGGILAPNTLVSSTLELVLDSVAPAREVVQILQVLSRPHTTLPRFLREMLAP